MLFMDVFQKAVWVIRVIIAPMNLNFDNVIDRRSSESLKWRKYPDDVIPLWVADMDFRSPSEVINTLHQRIDHGVYGYGVDLPELRTVIAERMDKKYHWLINPEDIIFLPGVIRGFNLACQMVAPGHRNVIVQTPVYPPILKAPGNAGLERIDVGFQHLPDGSYSLDEEQFSKAMIAESGLFILCNPHNPLGHVFSRKELEVMAAKCLEHGLIICSDEIHGELIFSGYEHIPIASLNPEIAKRTITLSAPSKTFNLAGLDFSYAVIQDEELRKSFIANMKGLVGGVNILAQVAALAAYRHGDAWLEAVLRYLERNRDYLLDFITTNIPGIKITKPEATYLAWMDCRELNLEPDPFLFFLNNARVALWQGEDFGRGGEGHLRINFGCQQSTLEDALQRMLAAIEGSK